MRGASPELPLCCSFLPGPYPKVGLFVGLGSLSSSSWPTHLGLMEASQIILFTEMLDQQSANHSQSRNPALAYVYSPQAKNILTFVKGL